MSKDLAKSRLMRERLAQLAARLMAEDGIDDFAMAKRKAAKQLGVPDTRHLPTNQEIEVALREYREIYFADEHAESLRDLRQKALATMRSLEQFQPYLVGSVLTGIASPFACIELQLCADSGKEVEMYLLGNKIEFEAGEQKMYFGGQQYWVPVYTLDIDGTEVRLAILESDGKQRNPARNTAEGRPLERARIDQVEHLLAAEPTA